MKELKVGMFARSLAGHDKGKLYIVTAVDGDMVYLANGKTRLVKNPKKKKRRHIQPEFTMAEIIGEKLAYSRPLLDEEIRKAIKTKEV